MSSLLADGFQTYFSVDLATSEELKKQVYQVRYRVYCEEFQYEPTSDDDDGEERDDFDDYSLHCIIRHKPSGYPAGCVRLVPGATDGHDALLPLERFCPDSLDNALLNELQLPRSQMCEVSRLAVDGSFRRRHNEHRDRFGSAAALTFGEEEQRVFPLIAVSAFLAATSMSIITNKTHAFAMMEPFLPKLLKRSGINFTRAGEDVDYHGIRAPYYITAQEAIDNMKPELRSLYDDIHAILVEEFQQAR
ncbi:PEP-CTERM/exosortase system-associated acyltransferase [Neptunomonas sp. XY-337]|uniref:PEP-CTERM/exosortase system-associated acyltransferase n=1 Tax=Neptunomonas sp. XY-337 TaxID=2561897 RepID=UPI0010A9A762|nr:PEP-CTERM/exosortase system-associated acyltransferase [Neptunomonas sp. XY-337]